MTMAIINNAEEADSLPMQPPSNKSPSKDGKEEEQTGESSTGGGGNRSMLPQLSTSQIERRRQYTHRQNLRRQVYRELTVYQMYPLQAMAMDDYDVQCKDYFSCAEFDGEDSDDGYDEDAMQRRMSKISVEDNGKQTSSECNDVVLRKQFMNEFLKERSIPVPIVAVTDATNALLAGTTESDVGALVTSDPTHKIDKNIDIPAKEVPVSNNKSVNSTIQSEGGEDDSIIDKNAVCTATASVGIEKDSKKFTPDSGECKNQEEQPLESKEVNDQPCIQKYNEQQKQHNHFQSPLWSLEPRIFACESSIKGKRRYICAHLGRFLDHYWRECDVYNRHYYELIKEDSPCRLYFDLEFNKRSNPNLTPSITEDLLTELFEELCIQFEHVYNISIQRSGMVDLDSSTPKKFSRHWILHLPNGELFSDAREAGIFVKVFVSRLEEEQKSGELKSKGLELLAENLFVNAEDSEEDNVKLTRFIDLGVYTRNRIFRIMGSTKFGKPVDAGLRIAEANEFSFPNGFDNSKFYVPAMNKAADPDEADAEDRDEIGDDDDFENFCNSLSFEDHAAALAATLVVPANASKMNYPILNDPSNLLSEDEKQQMNLLRIVNGSATGKSKLSRAAPSYGASPLPKLEHFIVNTLGRRHGLVGNIGTWSLGTTQQPLPQTICFNMKDNRFCDNVGRAHKSNNIIWNVHLIDRVCWQSCHDPECRGFRGTAIDLPEEVNPEIDEYFLDFELSSLNENEIIVENKENEGAANKANGEFDDPALEAAMCQFDISNFNQDKEDEAALDDELAKLNLSDIILGNNGKIKPLTDLNNQNNDTSSRKEDDDKEQENKPDAENRTGVSTEPWEEDNNLDSELLELAATLPDIFSSSVKLED